jgi:hypothetical protein
MIYPVVSGQKMEDRSKGASAGCSARKALGLT